MPSRSLSYRSLIAIILLFFIISYFFSSERSSSLEHDESPSANTAAAGGDNTGSSVSSVKLLGMDHSNSHKSPTSRDEDTAILLEKNTEFLSAKQQQQPIEFLLGSGSSLNQRRRRHSNEDVTSLMKQRSRAWIPGSMSGNDDKDVEYHPATNVTSPLKGPWKRVSGQLYSSENTEGTMYLDLEMKEKIENPKLKDRGEFLFMEGELNIRDGEYVTDELYFSVAFGIFHINTSTGYFYAFPPPVLHQLTEKIAIHKLPDADMHAALQKVLFEKKDDIIKKYNRLIEYLALSKYKCVYQSNFTAREMEIHQEPTFMESVMYQDASSVTRFEKQKRFFNLRGSMTGLTCENELSYDIETQDSSSYYEKSGYYTVMACGVGFLQIMFLLFQMKRANTQSTRSRISSMTIGMLGMLDSYAFLLHFTLSIYIPGGYVYISLVSFFNFVIFSIFEMKFMLKVWMSSRRLSPDQLRRQASALYTKYYGALFLGIIIIYQFSFVFKYVLLLLYSFWIPQIIRNFQKNAPKALHPIYVFGTGITRLIIPLYFFGCPENFFGTEVNYAYCFFLASWVFLQSSVLLFQYYFGSRSFVPKIFLPKKYNYKRPIPDELIETGELTCVICYENVDEEDHLVTPCNHVYHEDCLIRWMEVKLECPSCRAPIPFY